MYTLYWSADSGAFAVQAVLEELGQPYERLVMSTSAGDHRRPEFLAVNPMAQIPVLKLPDGTIVTESAAMVVHLCDAHPEAGLLPAPGTSDRATAYRWLFWLATGLYEADLRYYYADRYTADPAGADDVRSAALERMNHLLGIAEGLIARPYALGEQFSAVDPYLFMLTLWHPDHVTACARHPALGELVRRVRQRPAVERIWWQHHPAEAVP